MHCRYRSCPGAATINTRQIVFISPPDVKNAAQPAIGHRNRSLAGTGQYFDPWGNNYVIRIDSDYNNQVANPYTANAGATPLSIGVIAWSLGYGPSWWIGRQECQHRVRRRDFVAVIRSRTRCCRRASLSSAEIHARTSDKMR